MAIRRVILGTGVFLAGAAAAGAITWTCAVRPRYESWGADPDEAEVPLPGDGLVPDPTAIDTRGIDIAVSPEAVWPWLVQMGYGRAGWYSYDAMDMRGRSADRILPEFQALAVGDTVPTSPDTAFSVKVLEPGSALVLYFDEQLLNDQTGKAREAAAAGTPLETTPANLRVTGAMMPSMAGFAASWAFALRPLADGHGTRLIERFRMKMASTGPGSRIGGAFLGLGVFAMERKQMLGIRDRAEGAMAGVAAPVGEKATPAAEVKPESPAAPSTPPGDEALSAPA